MNKIVFFGNERLATGLSTTAPTLRALIAADYEITAVVVAQNDSGNSRKQRQLEIVQVAEEHGIPVLAPAKPAVILDFLRELNAEIAVLVAYGKIVPQSVIDVFPKGIVNIHPSLLPKHRGSIPIESVILNNDKETGVSLMQLTAKMDAGPVYSQTTVALHGNETKLALASQLQQLGADMLISNLPSILNGSLQGVPQNNHDATYDERITKNDSILDFKKPAEQLEREIRAYASWPRSRTTIGNIEVIITSASVADGDGAPGALWRGEAQLGLYCSEGILLIDSLIPVGKKEMSISSFITGYQDRH